MTEVPDQSQVLQGISDDWKNRDQEPTTANKKTKASRTAVAAGSSPSKPSSRRAAKQAPAEDSATEG